jgi:hypothetical protein
MRPERNQGNCKNKPFCPEPDIVQIISSDSVLFGLLVPDQLFGQSGRAAFFN